MGEPAFIISLIWGTLAANVFLRAWANRRVEHRKRVAEATLLEEVTRLRAQIASLTEMATAREARYARLRQCAQEKPDAADTRIAVARLIDAERDERRADLEHSRLLVRRMELEDEFEAAQESRLYRKWIDK